MSLVLLVDDCEDIREMMSEFLHGEGFDVLEAGNGEEALHMLDATTRTVDLIMLDLAMPVMNGLEFMQVIDRDVRHAALPIIMISATPEPVTASRAAMFLKKPVDLDTLLMHARAHCPSR
jgi:CheY-like chemotaxis protein